MSDVSLIPDIDIACKMCDNFEQLFTGECFPGTDIPRCKWRCDDSCTVRKIFPNDEVRFYCTRYKGQEVMDI